MIAATTEAPAASLQGSAAVTQEQKRILNVAWMDYWNKVDRLISVIQQNHEEVQDENLL